MHAMYYLHDITFSHAVRQVSCLTSVMLQQMCLHSQLCHSVMSFATVAQSCVLSPLLCSAASTENCVFSFHCHHAVIHRHSSICCYKTWPLPALSFTYRNGSFWWKYFCRTYTASASALLENDYMQIF